MTDGHRGFPDRAALAAAAAARVADAARAAVRARGRFLWVLSGGRTPLPLYQRLASWRPFPWDRTHVFWGDERCVPRTAPESNAGQALRLLLTRVPIPRDQIHPPPAAAASPAAAAARWEADLRRFFGPAAGAPAFDLVLLGLGADGHTASLFPGDAAVEETVRWTAAVDAPQAAPPVARVTLTLPALAGAREVLFLVAGAGKQPVLTEILAGGAGASRYPAARVAPRSRRAWWVAQAP